MRLGISSWAFPWSVGLPGHEPSVENRMTADRLIDWAWEAQLSLVQLADNLPLDSLEKTVAIRERAEQKHIEIELGTRGVDHSNLSSYLSYAQFLGCRLIRTLLSSTLHQSFDAAVSEIGKVLPEFERSRIILALENYEAYSSAYLLRLVNHFGSECLRVCLDTTNSFGALESPDETVNTLAPVTANLHIKEFVIERIPEKIGFLIVGRPAGQGVLNIPRILKQIRSCSPGANVILEQWPPYAGSVEQTVRVEQDWARHGIEYLRRTLDEL